MRLSGGDPIEADDLLHNAFLQFVLRRRDLSEIENLEAYLYGLLRRLRLSEARKALRRRHEALLAVDYDAAEMCLSGADVRELLQVKAELSAVCDYACLRKESSKAGSVLILRFFHGYYPKEIARILNSPLRLANDWLRIARQEARTYLESPSRLSFLSRVKRPNTPPNTHHQDDGRSTNGNGAHGIVDLLDQLRARIRQARTGRCLEPVEMELLYGGPSENTVPCSTLSHIVSCPECLEFVSRHLDLGSYSDRDPRDMLGPDGGWRTGGDGSRGNGNGHGALLRVGARRLRALLEHRPTELLIAANGLPLGTLTVRSIDSQLELAANLDEPIDFIEIFSEQNVRVLMFEVEPAPYGDVEQGARVAFDEGRWLQLKVDFTRAWPTVHLAYHDSLPGPATDDRASHEAPVCRRAVEPAAEPASATLDQRDVDRPRVSRDVSRVPRWRDRLSRVWRAPLLRPAFGVAGLLAAVVLWAALPWHGRVASASELLRATRASEQGLLAAPNVVVHRVFLLEERRPPERAVLSRRRVEVWHKGMGGVAVRRLYDEQNHLAAGEWTGTDSSRTMYRPGAAPKRPRDERTRLVDPNAIWSWEPSALHFAELLDTSTSAAVENRPGDYLLRYRSPSDDAQGVVEATLTVSKADMRAVAQTLLVRFDNGLREYAFTETAWSSVPASTVPTTTFEPEAELVGRLVPVDVPVRAPSVEPKAVVVSTTAVLGDEEGNRLEIEALFALHRLESCLAGPGKVTRASDGVHARAVAVDALCRDRVGTKLAALGPAAAIKADVTVAAAPLAAARGSGDSLSDLPPAYRLLAERLNAGSGSASAETADAARRIGAWALTISSRALAEARELERLVVVWTPQRLAALDVDRTTMWLDVVRDHARRLGRDTEQIRTQLQNLLAIDVSKAALTAADVPLVEIRRSGDVSEAVTRLVSLAESHETAMRQLFDAGLSAPRVPVNVSALARSLRAAEQQAAQFDEPWTIDP